MKLANDSILSDKSFKGLLFETGVLDSSYPTAVIWLPYGVDILNRLSSHIRKVFLNHGFSEYIFPSLVNLNDFNLINKNIFSFIDLVYKPDKNLILKPSGESIIYPMFKKWIKDSKDLPIKIYQIGEMFRKGRPRGLFRKNESDFFIEAHTAHSSREDAFLQLNDDNKVIEEILDCANIPCLFSERPFWTNKPVAEKHIGIDVLLPNGETLLVASSYAQMQVFSKIFNIVFKNIDGVNDFTYQTSLGFSHRIILASLLLSSDQNGFCIYPEIAPIQVVVVQIDDFRKEMSEFTKIVVEKLSCLNYRVKIEYVRKKELHKIFCKYEKKGVPLRVEIGKDEEKEKKIKVVRRDNFDKRYLYFKELGLIENLMKEIEINLKLRVNNYLKSSIVVSPDARDMKRIVDGGKIAKIFVCKKRECVTDLPKKIGFGEVLGFIDEAVGCCVYCKKNNGLTAYYSRRI